MSAPGPVADLPAMLAALAPVLDDRSWQFMICDGPPPEDAFAVIREAEGVTTIVPQEGGAFARITLQVHSALEGVGLTAAVTGALARADIACNVVAGFHHDHLFVPRARAAQALAILGALAG